MAGSRSERVNLAARLLITAFGDSDEREAAKKADKKLEQGSARSKAFWLEVMREIDRLQAESPEGIVD